MRTLKLVILSAALAAAPLSLAFAGGAGGVTWSNQHAVFGLPTSTLSVSSVGGFGYGVSPGGTRTGGFGFALYSVPGGDSLSGGVGGFIVGQEGHAGPFTAAVNLWTGLGGVSATMAGVETGALVLFGEANVELGAAVTPWMQLVLYGGVQGLADVSPGHGIGSQILSYAPVIGMRLAWGSFGTH
ncbi:MAG TPA: hypothetical protein VMV03_04945 [Spirochaetia bacterium]|nr:hypothetical protein [Spirochaetia bacterium]